MNTIRRTPYIQLTIAFIILLVLLSSVSVIAQNFKQVVANLHREYEKMEKLHVAMVIQVFGDSLSKKPFYNQTADIKRDGKNYLYQFGNNEMLMNSKYLIVVDKNSHEIVCSKRDVKGEEDFIGKDPIKLNMDSMLNLYDAPKFIGKINTVEHYRVFQKRGVITRMDMMIDTEQNALRAMQYFYKDGQYVRIDFQVFDKQPEFKAGTFDESAYMISVKGKLKGSPAYQRYTVLEVKN